MQRAELTLAEERNALEYDPWGERDATYRTMRDRFVTTRKPSQCAICFEPIPAGSRVRAKTEVDDGHAATFRFCPECCWLMANRLDDDVFERLMKRYDLGRENVTQARTARLREQVQALQGELVRGQLYGPECPYAPYEDTEAPEGVDCTCPREKLAARWKARWVLMRAERDAARIELAEAREQFDLHVAWASDQAQALEAERDAAREALRLAFRAGFLASPHDGGWAFTPEESIAADREEYAWRAWAALGQPKRKSLQGKGEK